jgi:chromosomal replication initiation ATPase DnaA
MNKEDYKDFLEYYNKNGGGLLFINEQIIDDYIESKKPPKIIPAHKIMKIILEYFNLNDFNPSSHEEEYCRARQIAIYCLFKYSGLHPKKIGMLSEIKKDRVTVLYSIKVVKNDIETNSEYAKKIKEIEDLIK